MSSPYADTPVNRPASDDALKVGQHTNPGKLGKSIQMTLLERRDASNQATLRIRAMGPEAANQTLKGLAIARQNLTGQGFDICAKVHFESHTEKGESLSVLVVKLALVADA